MNESNLARMIDHTLLKPDATATQIAQLCDEARQYHFASVCVNPSFVAQCSQALAGSDVPVCTVIGFPLGATSTSVKVFETQQAIRDGASEVDMVIAIGRLKGGEMDYVRDDIAQVVAAAHAGGALCKVIIETALLSDDEKRAACTAAVAGNADFVKTSTGFSGGGATVADIALMREAVGPSIGVKASGGVRSLEDARSLIAAGATRLGASAGVQIVQGLRGETAY